MGQIFLSKTDKAFQNRLPKTGQTTIYYAGDNGTRQSGLDIPAIRFEEQNISGDDVIIDHHTGLMWPKNKLEKGCNYGTAITWSSALDYCKNLSFAGFNDWRSPNNLEYLSIFNYEVSRIYPFFINFEESVKIWSSTTWAVDTSKAVQLYNNSLGGALTRKTYNGYVMAVREL